MKPEKVVTVSIDLLLLNLKLALVRAVAVIGTTFYRQLTLIKLDRFSILVLFDGTIENRMKSNQFREFGIQAWLGINRDGSRFIVTRGERVFSHKPTNNVAFVSLACVPRGERVLRAKFEGSHFTFVNSCRVLFNLVDAPKWPGYSRFN